VGGSGSCVSGAALRLQVASHSKRKRRASATPSRALTLASPGGRATRLYVSPSPTVSSSVSRAAALTVFPHGASLTVSPTVSPTRRRYARARRGGTRTCELPLRHRQRRAAWLVPQRPFLRAMHTAQREGRPAAAAAAAASATLPSCGTVGGAAVDSPSGGDAADAAAAAPPGGRARQRGMAASVPQPPRLCFLHTAHARTPTGVAWPEAGCGAEGGGGGGGGGVDVGGGDAARESGDRGAAEAPSPSSRRSSMDASSQGRGGLLQPPPKPLRVSIERGESRFEQR
jgi:hypothetical protein